MGVGPSDLQQQFKVDSSNRLKKNEFQKIKDFVPKDLTSLIDQNNKLDKFQKLTKIIGDKQFTDSEFPAVQDSLSKDIKLMSRGESYTWKRAKELFDFNKLKVFQKKIEPNDIYQGALGDCYFLSALSVLAERPNLIERNFLQKNVNEQGLYCVLLCVDGEFQEIIIDDLFPTNIMGKPAFSKSNEADSEQFGDELWVLLMEKAYAKVFGSYQNIVAGSTGNAIKDICGAPHVQILTKEGEEQVWNFISTHGSKGHMLSAGSGGQLVNGKEIDRGQGIVSGHAYAILDFREVDRDGKERILKMRNPWGTKEWEGDWSDKSDKWTDKIKKEVDFIDADDGVFWISVKDFSKEFDDLNSNLLQEDFLYSSINLDLSKSNKAIVKVNIKYEETQVYFQLTQYDERHFHESIYKYSLLNLMIYNAETLEYVGQKQSNIRDLNIEAILNEGIYYAYVEVIWHEKCQNIKNLVFSTYSSDIVQIDEQYRILIDENELQIIDNALINTSVFNTKKIKSYKDYDQITRYTNSICNYLCFVFENKHDQITLEENVELLEPKNLQPCLPIENFKFQINVKPGEKKMVKYRITSETGGDFYFKANYTGGVVITDDILIEEIKKNGDDIKKQRQKFEVYYYPYYYDKGYMLLHWHKGDKGEYEEELELKLNNLELVGREKETNPVINFKLKPGEIKVHKLNIINRKDEFSFKVSLWCDMV